MRRSPLRVLGRRAAVACAALAGILGIAGSASGASLAYIDAHEVWVSTLDGSRKERLSAGEGDWIAVTAADNGRILGVRLEAGKIFQLAKIQLWDSNGSVLSQGPLPSVAGWNSYVAPLGLDLTSDGVFAVYGYAGQVGFVPNASFPRGHYAILSDTKTNLTPIGQSGYLYPTTVGRRVVAAQGSQVVVQAADTSNPFSTTWTPIIDTAGTGLSLRRTDVAATGRLAAAELTADPGDDRIAALSLSGIDAPVTVGASADCFLPTVGEATDPTLSQDATRIAWKDAQGVKIAGAPSGNTEPCALASPPIVISATGSSPSIGGADVAQLKPAAPGPAAPGTTPPPAPLAADAAGQADGRRPHRHQGAAPPDTHPRRREGDRDRIRRREAPRPQGHQADRHRDRRDQRQGRGHRDVAAATEEDGPQVPRPPARRHPGGPDHPGREDHPEVRPPALSRAAGSVTSRSPTPGRGPSGEAGADGAVAPAGVVRAVRAEAGRPERA